MCLLNQCRLIVSHDHPRLPVLTLERVPVGPELGHDARVAELTGVGVNRPGSVNLAQLPLHLRKSSTHVGCLPIRQRLEGSLIDWSRGWQTEVRSRLGNVNDEHFVLVGILDRRGGAIVDAHRAFCQTVVFFQLGVHEEEGFAVLFGTVFEGLLEEISRAFELFTAIPLDEFGEVNVPDFKGDREVEQLDSSFVNLVCQLARSHGTSVLP